MTARQIISEIEVSNGILQISFMMFIQKISNTSLNHVPWLVENNSATPIFVQLNTGGLGAVIFCSHVSLFSLGLGSVEFAFVKSICKSAKEVTKQESVVEESSRGVHGLESGEGPENGWKGESKPESSTFSGDEEENGDGLEVRVHVLQPDRAERKKKPHNHEQGKHKPIICSKWSY